MSSENKNANDRGYKKEANHTQGTPSMEDKTELLLPPCHTMLDLEETPLPTPRKDVKWYRITSRGYPCPFLYTAKSNSAQAGSGTILHRRKYETEKYADLSYENNIVIGKNHVRGWEYFISVSKL